MENSRWVIYNCGYVSPSGRVTPDWVLQIVDDKPQHVSDDCYAVQQEHDGIDWVDIDNTKVIGEWFASSDRTVKTKLNVLQQHTNNKDLDSQVHKGFTIGKGKVMYFMYVWHKSGNATVYGIDSDNNGRYVQGDVEITIHWK